MAFDDAFGSGQDQLRQSLLEQYQPDDGQPFSVNPQILTDRLARKLAIRPTRDANVDFNVAPEEKEKAPDLSKFGSPVKDEAAPEPSTDDLSKFGTKVEPEGPPQPPLTIARQGAAALKGIPHGAISAVGGTLKGAGAVYDNGIPEQPETPQFDPMGNATGMTNPAAAAVPPKPLKDRTLYKAGQATQDFAQTVAPMTDQEKQSIGGRIGTGVGSLAVYGAATLAAGPLVGLPAAATGMALDTYGSVFEAAKTAGKTDDEAAATAGKSALVAGVLGSLPLGAGKYAKSLIAKMALSSAAFATLGEAQEAILQEIAKDYDPKAGYTFDQKRLIAELILGAGMGGLHHAFERGQQPPQPAPGTPPPGTMPGANPGLPPGGPGPGPQPGAGPRPNGWPGGTGSWGAPPPGGGAGPRPNGGPQPGPSPGGPGQQQAPPGAGAGPQPGKPPPGTGTGKAGEAGYTMDPATRAKMERVYRHFEQGKDPSGMTDGELFDAVNEHLRDTSSTGHTAKPESPEEAAAREATAAERTEREELIKRGWKAEWVNAMTPEQRQKALNTGRAKAGSQTEAGDTTAPENATKQQGTATNSGPDKVVPTSESDVVNPTPGTREAPIKATTSSDILDALPAEPKSSAQAEAENYKHAHVEIEHLGLTGRNSISIETGVGQERKGTDPDGKEWSVTMPVAYGRIKGTKGGDGQPLDIFIGPQPTSPHVFVVDQHHANGGDFDEHKILAGFPGPDAALRAYADSYNDKGGDRIGHVTALTPAEFQAWLKTDTSVALKKDIQQPEIGSNVANPTYKNAAPPESHHTPEGALPNPESHHTPGRAGEETNEQRGAAPTADSPSLNITKPSDSVSVKSVESVPGGANGGPSATKKAPKSASEPQNLLQFIAAKGGLKPHPELAVMDAHKHVVAMSGFPYRRKLVRDGGMDLDRAREAAEEAGYFRGSGEGTSTIAEFLDAIDDGIRGQHRYPEGHEGTKTKAELAAEDERIAHEEARIQEFIDAIERTGAGGEMVAPEIKARALQLMHSTGLDAPEAVETAWMQLVAEEKDVQTEFYDTYGHEVDDEIYAQAASDYGENLAREGGAGHGDEEAAAGGSRPGGPVAGAESGRTRNDTEGAKPDTEGEQPDTGRNAARAGRKGRAENSGQAERSERDLTDDFIAGIEREIAAGRTDADISPTRSLADFQKAAEARGWTYGAYGKGKALWSPDRSHVIFASVSVEGNHVTAQWSAPGEGITPPETGSSKVAETVKRSREAADRINKREDARHAEQLIKDDLPSGAKLVEKDGKFALEVGGKVQSGYHEYKVDAIKDFRRQQRDAPTWAEILHELPMSDDGRTRQHEIAFDAITAMTGKKKPKYDDLTPAQKHELLAKLKAGPSPEEIAYIEGEKKDGAIISVVNGDDALLWRGPYSKEALDEVIERTGVKSVVWKPQPTTETGADNKPQMVMPGAEKASDGTMAKRAAAQPLKPKVAQKAADDGLFGDGHKQTDIFDAPAKKPAPPKDAFDDIFDAAVDELPKPDLSIDDVAKGLTGLFGKGLAEPESPFDDTKYQAALPFFKAGMKHFAAGGADLPTMVRALVKHLSVAGMDADAIRAMKPYIRRFTDDVTAGRETINAPSRSDVLESDRGKPEAGNGVGKADVSPAAGPVGQGAGKRGSAADAGDQRPADSVSVPQDHAPVVGAKGNLELPHREPVDEGGDAADRQSERSGDDRAEGFSFDDGTTDEAVRNAQKDADLNARRERQRKAEGTPVKPGDIANIADTLPMLFPEQHDDVLKAEQRYAKPDGHGMLFTNGTGTGKTYSGLGVIKRFAMQGKTNALVVAPSQGILMDWVRSAKDLGLDMRVLDSTVDNGGKGLVGTTYANLGANRTLADREWDLVVPDEAHKLSSDQNGTATAALGAFRAITNHPDGLTERARMVLRTDWDRIDQLPKDKQAAAYAEFEKKAAPLIAKWKAQSRPKALFMSATPFAYHFSLDYAEGFLFEFDRKDQGSRYNSGGGREKFYMQHLGYRMRTNKLTKPDADVKAEVMERQLHEYLKKQGSLSGRALTVDKDYDRKFVLAHDAVGEQIDRALNFLQEAEDGRYRPLHELISKQFDYLTRMRLLEAIKARAAVPFIKESLALGRKIVVFHDYNEGGGINPFDLAIPKDTKTTTYQNGKHVEVSINDMYDDFRRQNPYIKDLKFASYLPPIAELTKSFPDAMVYNGTVSNKIRNEAKRLFNDDNSGRDTIIVQSAAGEAGISLHDTTGKRQRVLLNLGMPIRPTSSIQQEGRIYRVGQSSDAIFRYMNTGTDWERWTFAGKIAERAGTAENLALGDQARTIRQSFVDAFSNAGDYAPEHGEGKGGKEADRAISHSVSEFDKAKTHYFANGKTSGRRDQREGIDYYATPEPIGLKMVEFAGLKPGEKILEPSAGHGAISRYFPEDSARTLVEPSSSLASRAALTSPGARVVVDRFENLDKGANKFDAIVMNPPFGHGGATAIEHLSKAMGHLKNGGRIVALIPTGSTDAKFIKLMDSVASKDIYLVGDIKLPSVTFERAGTSINARIVVLEKQTDQEVRAKLQSKSRDYSDVTKIGELFDRIENAVLPDRLEPKTKDVDAPAIGPVTINGIGLILGHDANGVYADLKGFIGDRFRGVAATAERNGGMYIKGAKRFKFGTKEQREKFLNELANPPPEAAAAQPSAPSGVTFKTGETIHAKTRAKLFVATANERVAGDVYSQMNAVAKANGGYYSSFNGNGGYYSSFNGNGAIPGFQFKSAEERQKFLDQMGGGLGEPPAGGSPEAGSDRSRPAGERGQQFALNKGRRTGKEYMIAYAADGHAVSSADGTSNFVGFSPEFIKELMKPENDIIAHHNHPTGMSLSELDIMTLAYPGMSAIWAHGHNGNVYRGALTPEGKAALVALDPSPNAIGQRLKTLHQFTMWRLRTPMQEAFNQKLVTSDEANSGLNHLVNQVLHDAGILDYRTNYEIGDFISKVPGLDKTLANAVKAARMEVFRDEAAVNRPDRSARPLRHLGDLGASFDRGQVAVPVGDAGRGDRDRGESDFIEEGGGLAQPDNAFVKSGSHDVAIADILRTRLLGKLGQLNATEARTQLQDKFARVKNAEESVQAPSSQSAHQAESLYYGRTGQRLESLTEHHIDPIIREMKGRDVKLDKLDEFLQATHATERNYRIGIHYPPGHDFHDAIKDPNKVGGSGWSTNEAKKVFAALRAEGKFNDYLAVAKMVWALNAKTRRALFDAGLIDRDTYDAWTAAYKYYTPQRGHAEGDQFMASGSGMNVRGKEAKTAFGRRSKADSPLAYSIMQAEMAIVRAEKNKVGNTFLQFVRANPDPARWTIDRPPLVKKIDPTTGLVTSMPDNLYANRDNVFTTKVNGRDVHITLHGPDGLNLARALKNMGTANVHRLIRAYASVTHAMSKLATSWNPEFMIPNFARDLGEAFINLQAQEQRGFVKNFVKHIPGAMKGSMAAIAGRAPTPGTSAARYVDAFHRFDKAGGRVRFFGIDDPDQIETNVNRKLKRLEGGPLNTLKDIGDKAAKALEVAGGGIENATRLAAFMAAEDAGFSTADAAMLARNLTVDFNKKGELGTAVSTLYMFANAGIQGQARMVRALGYRRVWQAVAALAAAGALSSLFSILASDTDEAGIPDYMKIPSWERDKNLIFTLPGHYHLKVPLPYGFAPFAVIGSHAVSVAMGHEKPGKASAAIMDSILNAFNPLGEESSTLMDLVPSALRPGFHIQFNKNWTDRPLYPERDKNRGQVPDSTQAFKSNSAFSKEAAKRLNAWSGGNSYQPGAIDVHPGSIDHALQAITGGVGHFVKGIADSLYQNLSGGEWQPEKAPILRRFIGKVGPEADASLYYEKRQEALDEKAGINAARKDIKGGTNAEEAKQFLAEPQSSKASIFKSADERVKALRARKDLTEPELREQIRAVQNNARAQVQRLQPSP